MAKVTQINVEVTYLKSLPNYENVRVTAGATLDLQDGENVRETYEKAWDMIGQEVADQLGNFGK